MSRATGMNISDFVPLMGDLRVSGRSAGAFDCGRLTDHTYIRFEAWPSSVPSQWGSELRFERGENPGYCRDRLGEELHRVGLLVMGRHQFKLRITVERVGHRNSLVFDPDPSGEAVVFARYMRDVVLGMF